MNKPEDRYKKGSIPYRLLTGDWSRCSAVQIADALGSTKRSVAVAIHRVYEETGIRVEYMKVRGIRTRPKSRDNKKEKLLYAIAYARSGSGALNKCSTCWNFDCRFLTRRKTVGWKDCGDWMGGRWMHDQRADRSIFELSS